MMRLAPVLRRVPTQQGLLGTSKRLLAQGKATGSARSATPRAAAPQERAPKIRVPKALPGEAGSIATKIYIEAKKINKFAEILKELEDVQAGKKTKAVEAASAAASVRYEASFSNKCVRQSRFP